jgi:hypothetical protein
MFRVNTAGWQERYSVESSPWYEFNSYLDCCLSLGVTPSVGRWSRYMKMCNERGVPRV